MKSNELEIEEYTKPPIRDRRGLIQVLPDTRENFFGEKLVKKTRNGRKQIATGALKSQNFAQVSISFAYICRTDSSAFLINTFCRSYTSLELRHYRDFWQCL